MATEDSSDSNCVSPGFFSFNPLRCLTPQEIHQAYGVDILHEMGLTGDGMKLVILNVYANDTAENDLQIFFCFIG
ncbi:hypothetical protein [uncultured Shewanella sp.]|uniref:hypothetical protein n=1 Tax=uncultured Shewanella sp. TaxID=173975 RepID=UPI0026392E10|nr:hypothetical protein [uncultured Shewanella sp.]